MTGKTHDLASTTALILFVLFAPEYFGFVLPVMTLPTAVVAFGANFIGGLFPDIDQPTSDFWDNFRFGPLVAKVICPAIGGHRHLSHSLLGLALTGGGLKLLFEALSPLILIDFVPVWWAFMIGVVSHLATDIITKDGLPLLWPLKWRFGIPPIKALRIRAGSFMENLVIFPGLLLYTFYLIYTHQDKVLFLLKNIVK